MRSAVGSEDLGATVPMIFSGDETTDVGEDLATPVSDDYGPTGNAFSGTIHWVQIDLGDDALDHEVSPEERMREERMRVAMARR